MGKNIQCKGIPTLKNKGVNMNIGILSVNYEVGLSLKRALNIFWGSVNFFKSFDLPDNLDCLIVNPIELERCYGEPFDVVKVLLLKGYKSGIVCLSDIYKADDPLFEKFPNYKLIPFPWNIHQVKSAVNEATPPELEEYERIIGIIRNDSTKLLNNAKNHITHDINCFTRGVINGISICRYPDTVTKFLYCLQIVALFDNNDVIKARINHLKEILKDPNTQYRNN